MPARAAISLTSSVGSSRSMQLQHDPHQAAPRRRSATSDVARTAGTASSRAGPRSTAIDSTNPSHSSAPCSTRSTVGRQEVEQAHDVLLEAEDRVLDARSSGRRARARRWRRRSGAAGREASARSGGSPPASHRRPLDRPTGRQDPADRLRSRQPARPATRGARRAYPCRDRIAAIVTEGHRGGAPCHC